MRFDVPRDLKPIAQFAAQVVVGAIGFAVVMSVAVALGFLVRGFEALGFGPPWFTNTAEWVRDRLVRLGSFPLQLVFASGGYQVGSQADRRGARMKHQGRARRETETFTIDGAFLREQAREAMKLFFAPLSGVYHAITDPSVTRSDKRA